MGVFLDFLENQKNGQPLVSWYTSLNVPVWYPWTDRHQKAIKGRPQFAYLQPSPELLHAAATILIQVPTAILPLNLLPSSLPQPQSYEPPLMSSLPNNKQPYEGTHDGSSASNRQVAQNTYIATKPWSKFFKFYDEQNKKKIGKNNTSTVSTLS